LAPAPEKRVTEPKVSVIVVSYNRSADLRLCLSAVFASELDSLQVIVVDNASSDDALTVAHSFPRATVIANSENVGFAAANNLALEHARGEYVALVNDDAVVDPAWLTELVSFLDRSPHAAAAGGRLYHWNDENPVGDRTNHFFGYGQFQADGSTPAARDPQDLQRETPFLSGAAVLIRRSAIDAVGAPFLDPLYFMYYEETDFFARAVRRGFRTYFLAGPACWHRIRGGATRAPYRYHYYMHRNRVLFAHRHLEDSALAELMRTARWRAIVSQVRTSLRIGFGKTEALTARRDAWSWVRQNRVLLADQRLRFRAYGEPLGLVLASIARREAKDE
jgi:hypothetical protein